jgi:hypothetical protein
MNTMLGVRNMCNVKASTNMSIIKVVIFVWNVLEVMLFLHHDARSLLKMQGPIYTGRLGRGVTLNR